MTTAVKERGILFQADMIRRLLAGEKSQTRRAVNLSRVLSPKQKEIGFQQCDDASLFRASRLVEGVPRLCVPVRHPNDAAVPWGDCGAECLYCPYGKVGDHLIVREAWAASRMYDGIPPRDISKGSAIYFRATHPKASRKWRTSIHLPYWASRITLRITDVRVQRVQDISSEDVIAEGVEYKNGRYTFDGGLGEYRSYRDAWCALITSHGRAKIWEDNAWLWALSFERVEPT